MSQANALSTAKKSQMFHSNSVCTNLNLNLSMDYLLNMTILQDSVYTFDADYISCHKNMLPKSIAITNSNLYYRDQQQQSTSGNTIIKIKNTPTIIL